MNISTCPHCDQPLGFKQRYLAGLWRLIRCAHCGKPSCKSPVFLAAFYMLYLWLIMWFGAITFLKHDPSYLLFIPPLWAILDYFNYAAIPLNRIRSSVIKS